jgi:hypothetical protein
MKPIALPKAISLVVTQRGEDTCGVRGGCVWASAIVARCPWTQASSGWAVGVCYLSSRWPTKNSPSPRIHPLRLSLSIVVGGGASGGGIRRSIWRRTTGERQASSLSPSVSHSLSLSAMVAAELLAGHVRATNDGRPGRIRPLTGTR